MAQIKKLIHSLFPADGEPAVHFHSGPEGQPTVCHDERCHAPRLNV